MSHPPPPPAHYLLLLGIPSRSKKTTITTAPPQFSAPNQLSPPFPCFPHQQQHEAVLPLVSLHARGRAGALGLISSPRASAPRPALCSSSSPLFFPAALSPSLCNISGASLLSHTRDHAGDRSSRPCLWTHAQSLFPCRLSHGLCSPPGSPHRRIHTAAAAP